MAESKRGITMITGALLWLIMPVASIATPQQAELLRFLLPDTCVFSAQFTQTRTLTTVPTPLISSGTLFFSCDHGLIWHTTTPIEETLVYTRQPRQFRIRNGQTENITGPINARLAALLLSLMGGEIDQIQTLFTVTTAPATDDGRQTPDKATTATLVPQQKSWQQALHHIELSADGDQRRIQITDHHQQSTLIQLIAIDRHTTITPELRQAQCLAAPLKPTLCAVLLSPPTDDTGSRD